MKISVSEYNLISDKDFYNITVDGTTDYSFKSIVQPTVVEVLDKRFNKAAFAVIWRHKLCGKRIRYYTKDKKGNATAPCTIFDQIEMSSTQKKDFITLFEKV